MTVLQNRFKKIVLRFGETFTTGGRSGVAIFSPITSSLSGMYLTRTETDAAGRPIRVAYVAYDDATAETATLAWNGLILTVKRAIDVRFRGATVARMLVCV